ncbi:hypothetical protein EYZ11_010097 [Aspergillus tanneri]|uniref:Uncharacterized protein n=1 Tax=Aspergillus tanneri TaxID=1220188 RepID=A0A4S3J8A8_9EURO|nr:hypothetical protein EYZ11_010097 [Aspergillus tanneri]
MATSHPAKLCFVTVGATASFHQLLHAVLDQSFLVALHQFGYTHLLVQYGKDGRSLFEESLRQHLPGSTSHHGLEIDGFDFNAEGLDEEMRLAQLNPAENRSSGLIISHAGNHLCGLDLSHELDLATGERLMYEILQDRVVS